MNHLLNAPARISDLPLDQRRLAMVARDEQRRREWLASRERRSLAQRVLDRVLG